MRRWDRWISFLDWCGIRRPNSTCSRHRLRDLTKLRRMTACSLINVDNAAELLLDVFAWSFRDSAQMSPTWSIDGSTHGQRPMLAASPSIFCQVHFLPQVLLPLASLGTRRGAVQINIATDRAERAAVARRTRVRSSPLRRYVCVRCALQFMSSRPIASPRAQSVSGSRRGIIGACASFSCGVD